MTHQTCKAEWSERDGEWIGTCAQFPSLSFCADNRKDALEGIEWLVEIAKIEWD